jgi:hypothetical protein
VSDVLAGPVAQREQRERVTAMRSCGWALLGIASAEERGEEPAHTLGEVLARLERLGEGGDGRDGNGGHRGTA